MSESGSLRPFVGNVSLPAVGPEALLPSVTQGPPSTCTGTPALEPCEDIRLSRQDLGGWCHAEMGTLPADCRTLPLALCIGHALENTGLFQCEMELSVPHCSSSTDGVPPDWWDWTRARISCSGTVPRLQFLAEAVGGHRGLSP